LNIFKFSYDNQKIEDVKDLIFGNLNDEIYIGIKYKLQLFLNNYTYKTSKPIEIYVDDTYKIIKKILFPNLLDVE